MVLEGAMVPMMSMPLPGEIPQELEGTLLRNGPGLFEVGGVGISQPLDGDGMVSAQARLRRPQDRLW